MEILTNTWAVHELPAAFAGRPVELDMGCGKGSFTLALAQRYPERLILANDLISERLRILDRKRDRLGVTNLFTLRATSLALAAYQLPPLSIDRAHLICPDPWPKKHHLIRRLVCTDFLCRMRRILKPGAVFHLATDYTPYYEDWLRMFAQLPALYQPAPDAIADIADLKSDFELRWNALGQTVHHIAYRATLLGPRPHTSLAL